MASLVVISKAADEARLARKDAYVLEVAVREGALGTHVHPLGHHVEAVGAGEADRLPDEVDAHNCVGDWLDLQPDGLPRCVSSQRQRLPHHLWIVPAVDAEGQTILCYCHIREDPRPRPLLKRDLQ